MTIQSVFICYARPDREAAERLRAAFQAREVDAFVDYADTPGGVQWQREIPKQIAERDGMVIILSEAWSPEKSWQDRPWYVFDEVILGVERLRRSRDFTLRVFRPESVRDEWLPYGLRCLSIETLDLLDPLNAAAASDEAVERVLRSEAGSGPRPPDVERRFRRLLLLKAFWARDVYFDSAEGRSRRLTTSYVEPPALELAENDDVPFLGRRPLRELLEWSVDPAPLPKTDAPSSSAEHTSRWLVTGAAGSGKSISARWLAWRLANDLDEAPAGRGDGWVDVAGSSLAVRPSARRWMPLYLEQFDADRPLYAQLDWAAQVKLGTGMEGLGKIRDGQSAEIETFLRADDAPWSPVLIVEVAEPTEALCAHLEAQCDLDLLAGVPIFVFSKPEAAERLPTFARADIPGADEVFARRLARRHLEAATADVFFDLLHTTHLAAFVTKPLVLRWLLAAFDDGGGHAILPGTLPDLWERICGLYVRPRDTAMSRSADQLAARRAWGLMLYELRRDRPARVTQRTLRQAITRAFQRDGARPFLVGQWGLPQRCLDELLNLDRVLNKDDKRQYWFASEMMRDYLIADGYSMQSEAWVGSQQSDETHPVLRVARSTRTLTRQWANINFIASLGFRRPIDIVRLNTESHGWDGETLHVALREWMHAEALANNETEAAAEALRAWSREAREFIEEPRARRRAAAHVHYALSALRHEPAEELFEPFFEWFGLPKPIRMQDGWIDLSDDKAPDVVTLGSPRSHIEPFFAEGLWRDSKEDKKWLEYLCERERPHHVKLGAAYALAACPVTFSEYAAFDKGHAPGLPRKGEGEVGGWGQHPVTSVDWWHARLYAAWRGARLPTEGEWENACRAGSRGPYPFVDDDVFGRPPEVASLGDYIVYNRETTAPVGELKPNAWGLHDMLGQVWEWTSDRFRLPPEHEEHALEPRDEADYEPRLPSDRRTDRVARGGAYYERPLWVRSAVRSRSAPDVAHAKAGFRLARDLSDR